MPKRRELIEKLQSHWQTIARNVGYKESQFKVNAETGRYIDETTNRDFIIFLSSAKAKELADEFLKNYKPSNRLEIERQVGIRAADNVRAIFKSTGRL